MSADHISRAAVLTLIRNEQSGPERDANVALENVANNITQLDDADTPPIPMRLTCPTCCHLHIDDGERATKPHHTHACQRCGAVWRPAIVPTVGVRFLPGFKDEDKK